MKDNKNSINDYIIKETIGKGTFSKVKLGIHKKTNKKVAIKIMEKSKIAEKDDLERIIREMNMVTEFNHKNVIKVYEMFETKSSFLIIMEYCEGGELFDYIVQKKRLSEDEAAYFYYQLINGIEYIHSKGVVHRDLKPENILLDKNNVLKIIDFGLSNYYKPGKFLVTPCGSPCYASPEMVSGYKYNGFGIDVWSSGIILFAMLCGYLPFEDRDNDILFDKISKCKLNYPSFLSQISKSIMKKIIVNNPKIRIKINEIKQHDFYLKGQNKFNEKFKINNKLLSNEISRESTIYYPTTNNTNAKFISIFNNPKFVVLYNKKNPIKTVTNKKQSCTIENNELDSSSKQNTKTEGHISNISDIKNKNIQFKINTTRLYNANKKKDILSSIIENIKNVKKMNQNNGIKKENQKKDLKISIQKNIIGHQKEIKSNNIYLFTSINSRSKDKPKKIFSLYGHPQQTTRQNKYVPEITMPDFSKLPNIKIKRNSIFHYKVNSNNKHYKLKTDSNVPSQINTKRITNNNFRKLKFNNVFLDKEINKTHNINLLNYSNIKPYKIE